MDDGLAAVPEIPPALTAAFALLRRPRNERDDDADRELIPMVLERYGLLPSQTRRADLSGPMAAWVIPGTTGIGLSISTRPNEKATWYGQSASVAARGLGGCSVSLENVITHYGLVPDAVFYVRGNLPDGSQPTVSVEDNIFALEVPEMVESIDFLDAVGIRLTL